MSKLCEEYASLVNALKLNFINTSKLLELNLQSQTNGQQKVLRKNRKLMIFYQKYQK